MADTLITASPGTGLTVYLQLFTGTTVWNGTAFVSVVTANWTTYAVAMPETPAGFGQYVLDVAALAAAHPSAIVAGDYSWRIFLQSGASPASTDGGLGGGTAYWSGSTFGVGTVATVLSGVPANVIHSGTARGGTHNTITLDTGASSIDNTYQMNQVYLNGGTGQGQTAVILYGGYVGSTRVATISTDWATIPDSTTLFQVIPQGAVILGQIGGTARTVTQDYLGTNSLAVLDVNDQPIAGATVNAYLASAFSSQGTNAPVIASATTDSLGHWSLALAPSAYVLVFTFSGESSQASIVVS